VAPLPRDAYRRWRRNPGGQGYVKARLGNGVGPIVWESPHQALLTVVDRLCAEGVPYSEILHEMIATSASEGAGDAAAVPAVADLLSEPMTAAECVGTLLLATTAARARDARVDDEALLRVIALAAVLVARFETYLAERSSYPAS
jgi:hypothetical protein